METFLNIIWFIFGNKEIQKEEQEIYENFYNNLCKR